MKTIKKVIGAFSVVGMMGINSLSFAQAGNTGSVSIEQVSCLPDGLCTVLIEGDQVGLQACRSRQVVFDVNGLENGKAIYAMMLSAHVADRTVSFFISSCIDDGNGNLRPTFSNARIDGAG